MYFAPRNYWPRRYWPLGYWPDPTPKAVELDLLNVSGAARPLVVVPGAVAQALDAMGLASAAGALVVVPGGATVALGAAELLLVAEVVSAFGSEMTIALDALGVTGAVGDVVISISVNLDALGLTGVARTVVIVPGAIASQLFTVAALLESQALSIVPGDAVVVLEAALASLVAQVAEITGVTIDHTILLDVLGLSGVARALGVRPGPMIVPLQPVGMTAETYRLIVFTLLGCAIASVRGRAEATVDTRLTARATVSDRTGCR